MSSRGSCHCVISRHLSTHSVTETGHAWHHTRERPGNFRISCHTVQSAGLSYASDFFPNHFGPFHLPLISEYGEESISDENGQTETPHKSDRVEEIGVARAGINPEVVESWSEEC